MFQDVPSCMIAEQSWDSSEAGLRQAVAIQRDRYAKKKKRISAVTPPIPGSLDPREVPREAPT
ncbi:hypothetical protein QC764_0073960 [Podospora pseudoanserina]|uniref:Uncharacterized protein n=1 Tax=Podospora pseudoanserina TaxID=2609844 RepID=A0ABR0I544_9PEZI|nr:hypothetical protein QC764_0073960 [Podospora pseudoanserina]